MRTIEIKEQKIVKEYVCEVCGKQFTRSWVAEQCEAKHKCECLEHNYCIDTDEYDTDVEIQKVCTQCNTIDAIMILTRDLPDIWDLMSSKKLMENVNGNKDTD